MRVTRAARIYKLACAQIDGNLYLAAPGSSHAGSQDGEKRSNTGACATASASCSELSDETASAPAEPLGRLERFCMAKEKFWHEVLTGAVSPTRVVCFYDAKQVRHVALFRYTIKALVVSVCQPLDRSAAHISGLPRWHRVSMVHAQRCLRRWRLEGVLFVQGYQDEQADPVAEMQLDRRGRR